MIYRDIELHNVVEVEEGVGGGVRLHRFPPALMPSLSDPGRRAAINTVGSEIRFCTKSDICRVLLTATDQDTSVVVFHGDMVVRIERLRAGVPQQIQLERPAGFDACAPRLVEQGRFVPGVWRLLLGWSSFVLHDVQTFGCTVRPPRPDEKPRRRWLAHGSSITMGAGASEQHLSYVQVAAREAGVDVLNKGMGGSCRLEKEMADFLATGVDWDVATLELGINVRHDYSPEEFERRARYMVATILQHHPGKPLGLVTTFTNGAGYLREPDRVSRADEAFRAVLRTIANEHPGDALFLVEGEEMLDDPLGLTTDLVHPSDYGMIRMGQNLARKLTDLEP